MTGFIKAASCPAPAIGAFTGCYYNNQNLLGDPSFVRTDSQINFYWGNSSPDKSLPPLDFSVRWQGYFAFVQGDYTFSAITSDGMRLYIDGNLILDKWRDQPPFIYTVSNTITQGTHLVIVDYYEHLGGATAQLSWHAKSTVFQGPAITSFTASPANVAPGQPATLSWSAQGASSLSINNGVGDVTNRSSITVFPRQTTSYTLTAQANNGSSTATASVRVSASDPSAGSAGTCPPPATGAFTGCYFNNTTLSGNPVFIRTDKEINFSWGNLSPDRTLTPLNFSVRWQGNFDFDQENYNFSVITSDGMRLFLDGNLIIDRWRDQPPYLYTASQTVSRGTHLITVEYYERLGGATAQVWWRGNTAVTQPPAVSSFRASPATFSTGQPVVLSWAVTGATSLNLDNGIGDVTGRTSVTVQPTGNKVYTLTARNSVGTVTASVSVTLAGGMDRLPPTTPDLVSAIARTEGVLLAWTASTDNVAVAGYQVVRNNAVVASLPAGQLTYTDAAVAAGANYGYALKAYDAAGNQSPLSKTINVLTPISAPVTVKWYGGCWQSGKPLGRSGNFQSIVFALTTPKPVPVQGTLFFAPNCNPSQGTDNMNDFNTLTGSTQMVQGFTHYPDVIPSSALYWVGERTADGTCPPGSPCSGCVNYTSATLSCDLIP